MFGEEFSKDIIEKSKDLNNKLKLYTYSSIIEFNGKVIPHTIISNDELKREEEILRILSESSDKKVVIKDILENYRLTDRVKGELSKYRDILLDIRGEYKKN